MNSKLLEAKSAHQDCKRHWDMLAAEKQEVEQELKACRRSLADITAQARSQQAAATDKIKASADHAREIKERKDAVERELEVLKDELGRVKVGCRRRTPLPDLSSMR